jgi:hypothetical protein
MPAPVQATVAALKRLLDDRAERERDVRPARVEGRATDGRTLLLDLAGECILATGSGGYKGQIVTDLPALQNREGTTGVPVLPARDVATLIGVEALEPNAFPRGSNNLTVLVIGLGFTPTCLFEFLLPASETVNPGIEIVSSTFLDAQHFELVIDVAADAELVVDGTIAFDDPSRRFG